MKHVGVDGCRHGWISVFEDRGRLAYRLFRSFETLLTAHGDAERIVIDIPIGLPSRNVTRRRCDAEARRELGPRRVSVFPVPSRAASAETDITTARHRNRDELGKSLSAQSFAICGKIREVDDLLRMDVHLRHRVLEMHPEVCFWALNDRQPMQHSKSTHEGVHERLHLLSDVADARSKDLLDTVLREQLRKDVEPDDVLDAIAGLVTARSHETRLGRLGSPIQHDEFGLPMQMLYAVPAQAPRD